MSVALTRTISPNLGSCELTHIKSDIIDIRKCAEQHSVYEECLKNLGCTIRRLPETPELPDGVFVEDTAVVFPEVGIITRPGAVSRRGETSTMEKVLSDYRELRHIADPGTIDGGDVLTLGNNVYIGLTARSNREGIRQFANILKPFGYRVEGVPVTGCLHLKTAIAVIEKDFLLINPGWVDPDVFLGCTWEPVFSGEPHGANMMRFRNSALIPSAFPKTQDWLDECGYDVMSINFSELAKAEAGLTCCSVIIK